MLLMLLLVLLLLFSNAFSRVVSPHRLQLTSQKPAASSSYVVDA
jgi:ABC-type uncharacterized transport system involved in gliding motility auxiliary subunit